ncbi:FAD-dependent monooxygenase [Bradyrhizobium stylosanthis]|uniref:3-(3-hydroxy-phenyl)propionate hydroxylase n=1 Tax=Bradyrhizobium stylosanthis TaxID=1803665 RepID=A0A560DZA3_9BRAD|nr:FAD-dependent monooxygenase [Bradyrhizobium stylosanthis]TWB02417.1 3-(3-hydroxy-phenyl)propionate hydroxylase [Bradyrhizobium stylosanthis]
MGTRKSLEQFREAIKPVRGPEGRGWNDADVVIVGAGPIGLTAANILGSLGVKTILVERNEFTSDLPRALVVDDEYMRLLDNLGILPVMRDDVAAPFGIYFYSSRGRPIVRVDPFMTPNGFGTRTGIVQPVFEKILLSRAQRFECVDVQYQTTVTGLDSGAHGVDLDVRTAGRKNCKIRGRYLLACDGARSFVRSQLGIRFEGTRIDQPHLVIDLAEFPDKSPYSRFFCNPERPLNSIPTPYGGRRLEFMLAPDDDQQAIVTPETIRHLLDHHSPYKGAELKIVRSVVYGFSERIAQRLQQGRVFLLGDAAHVMPPFGAQAMNTGARDANNICWKIASVLSGRAGDRLLQTYESERRPQIEAIIRYSVAIGRLANIRNRSLAFARDLIFSALNLVPPIRRFFSGMRYMPKPWLERGYLVRHGKRNATPVGRIFPRVTLTLSDGTPRSIDEISRSKFVLVGIGVDVQLLRTLMIHPLARQHRWRGIAISLDDSEAGAKTEIEVARIVGEDVKCTLSDYRGKLLLVRPDGYVALAGDHRSIAGDMDALWRSFG